jgi:SAM-dependent methyltransferase
VKDDSTRSSNTRQFARLAKLSRVYTRATSPVAYLARKFIVDVSRQLSPSAAIALDLGCGTCPYQSLVCSSFRTDLYIGIDLAPTDTTVLVADAKCLPLGDASVDLIVSFDVIQHISKSEAMLDEMARVLIPNGYVLLTYPFLYPECDFHDFQRWTIEGMNDALARRGMSPVVFSRRGGPLFAAACALTWAVQHIIPGQRKSWRERRTLLGVIRSSFVALMTIPTNAIAWAALLVDSILPTRGAYMGGAVLARKVAPVARIGP